MEAGANTLAFVILAIKTTKLIHTVLRSIKDGPENVRRSADDVAGLLSTLEQLSRCQALDQRECAPLEARLLRCVYDLEAFDGDIKKLEVGDREGKRMRYWKRVKAAWGERRLEGMRVVVSDHCAALNLQLSALQSDAVFEMSDQLRTIDERLVSQRTIGEVPCQLRTITEELVSQRTVRETETLLWREQQTISAQVSENVVGIRRGIDTIGREVQAMSANYASRETQMVERLDEILYHILDLKLESQRESRAVEVDDEAELGNVFAASQGGAGPCLGFMESVKRLCRVVRKNQGRHTIGGDKDVVPAFLAMLQCMGSEEFLRDAVSSGTVDSGCCDDCSAHHLQDLKACLLSVYGSLASSQRVTLNQNDQSHERVQGETVQSHSTMSAYKLGISTMVVSSRRRVRALNHGQIGAPVPSSWFLPIEDVTTSITIIPSTEMKVQQMFKITIRRSNEGHGVFLSIPVLWVNNVLPAGSPVFSVVSEGRLEEFMKLLQYGRASIRDHDEDGLSLLHYSTEGIQPAMCRFLIEAGADVDCMARMPGAPHSRDYFMTPLVCTVSGIVFKTPEQVLACCGYLLDAGCDPTIPVFLYDHHNDVLQEFLPYAFLHSFLEGDIDGMTMMLDKGNAFAGVQTAMGGNTPLSWYCGTISWQMEGFALLVRHGANLRDRGREGKTCLHYCFESIDYHEFHPRNDARRIRDAIIYLIQQGADVFAEDSDGQSVSDYAYNPRYSKLDIHTSLMGDIWDCALINCGYDISDFGHGRKRKAVYSPWYTREGFEDLWAEFKHLCPYYDPQDDDIYLADWYYDDNNDRLVSFESDSEEGGVPL